MIGSPTTSPWLAVLGGLSLAAGPAFAANLAPTANAGPDLTANQQTTVTMAGSGRDPDGMIAAYLWTQTSGPGVPLTGANRPVASFVAPTLATRTQLRFRLQVTDNKGAKASDTVVVTVQPNLKPSANAGPDQTAITQTVVTLAGSGSDPDGRIASYKWTRIAGPAVTLTNANQASASFTAPAVTAPTTLGFRLTVKDNNGAAATDDIAVTVTPPPATASDQWVMGYYATYQRDLYPPAAVDWSGLTHLIVTRVKANADGTLDTNFDWDPTNGPAFATDLAARAHAAGRKAILMLGGDGNGAEILAAVTNQRAVFIANLKATMTRYGYDGLDLDWENQVDWGLFETFARELRQAMPNAILTAPVGALNSNYEVVEPHLPGLVRYLDRLNMMSYFPSTSWAGSGWLSWYNSPLTGVKPATPVSIADSLSRYAAAGIPKAKLGMGLAFYYTCYTGGITGPNQSTENGVTVAGGDNDAPLAELFGMNGAYSEADRYWDSTALEPYLSLPAPERHGCRYVSFEDEQSILEKGDFSRLNGYGGTILWTVNQGYVKTHSEPNFLFAALRQGFLEPGFVPPVGISIMQGNTWVQPGTQTDFGALITGTLDKTVTWSVTGTGCGSIDTQGHYRAPAAAMTCTVTATSQADTHQSASAKVTVSNASWSPNFSISRSGSWWVVVTTQDTAVNAMSVQMADGTIQPLSPGNRQWNNGYPIFTANYGFPDAGGTFTFFARSADNRATTVQLAVPPCVHNGDGICQ